MTTNLELQLAMWHERVYGPDDLGDAPALVRKLMEEAGELAEAVMLMKPWASSRRTPPGVTDRIEIMLEVGDVAIVLINLLRIVTGEKGLSIPIAMAHDKNERRRFVEGKNELRHSSSRPSS